MGSKMGQYSKGVQQFLFSTKIGCVLFWDRILCNFESFSRFSLLGIGQMLHNLGMTFDGRHHSGLDDSINIARIALELIKVSQY